MLPATVTHLMLLYVKDLPPCLLVPRTAPTTPHRTQPRCLTAVRFPYPHQPTNQPTLTGIVLYFTYIIWRHARQTIRRIMDSAKEGLQEARDRISLGKRASAPPDPQPHHRHPDALHCVLALHTYPPLPPRRSADFGCRPAA